MFAALKMMARYSAGLPGFLRRPLTEERARQRIEQSLAHREDSFLNVLRRGIFDNPASPYARLLQHAGLCYRDVDRLVREKGIEGALESIYDAGVYVTVDEFKGRRPIERPGLRLEVQPNDFDNPLLARHYEGQSSGSRGAGTRVIIDLDLLTHEAAYFSPYLKGFDLSDRPLAQWRTVPPVAAGMKMVLRFAKLGVPVERWFTQQPLTWRGGQARFALFTHVTLQLGKLLGRRLPVPEFVPATEAGRIAHWLADKKRAGTPAVLEASVSPIVRTCQAAREMGLDVAGTFFRVGGEPLTESRARLIASVGGRVACHYSITEVGLLGVACCHPTVADDVHVTTDKIALIQRRRPEATRPAPEGALVATTLLPSCPKLMLNVETGDFGVLTDRDCGCPLGQLGLRRHLDTIRSYEKLTSEGVTFLGTELLQLVDEVLPSRFGGQLTDYQLVEEEADGLSRVSVVVSPRVGPVDEKAVVATVLEALGKVPGGKIMGEQWRQGQTLRIVRREPRITRSGKIQTLHVSLLGSGPQPSWDCQTRRGS